MANAASRILTALVAVALGLAVAMFLHPEWLTGYRPAPAAGSYLIAEPSESVVIVSRRLRAKAQVIQALIAQELSLVEAAAAFAHLNAHPRTHRDLAWKHLPGRSDGERLCRQVIKWAEGHVSLHAPREAIEARLAAWERELSELVSAHGEIDLDALRGLAPASGPAPARR